MNAGDGGHDDEYDATDELVRRVRARFIACSDATFDFDAGLADVRRRAGLPVAPSGAGIGAVGRIDGLASLLGAVEQRGAGADSAIDQIRCAREVLFELRHALLTRTPFDAGQLLDRIGGQVERADRILRDSGTSLDEAISQRLGEVLDHPVDTAGELRALRGEVASPGLGGRRDSSPSASRARAARDAEPWP
ncbi:hypothetical protein [Streptacidiphilus carbonis]|uniref:hypothetical protein n=1 Tax=Streptacidiphilus carbonis TaxID=105422 RepID=UPI0005A95A36|nr:hypothetical protein [Streptacidiphilus carbonis]